KRSGTWNCRDNIPHRSSQHRPRRLRTSRRPRTQATGQPAGTRSLHIGIADNPYRCRDGSRCGIDAHFRRKLESGPAECNSHHSRRVVTRCDDRSANVERDALANWHARSRHLAAARRAGPARHAPVVESAAVVAPDALPLDGRPAFPASRLAPPFLVLPDGLGSVLSLLVFRAGCVYQASPASQAWPVVPAFPAVPDRRGAALFPSVFLTAGLFRF